jgi:hypothetical protein
MPGSTNGMTGRSPARPGERAGTGPPLSVFCARFAVDGKPVPTFGRNALGWRNAMAIVVLFLLGVANFAMHKAVIESGHPLLGRTPWFVHLLGGRLSLGVEFLMLLGSMLMVDSGALGWAWGYALYSALNALAAWLILSRRV